MTDLSIHYSSKRDDWPTPDWLFRLLDHELGPFTLDAAASDDNTKVPGRYYTIEDDGLAQPWTGRVFVNPPYGKGVIDQWVTRAIQAVRQGEASVVVLVVPARPGSRWFTQLIEHAVEVRFVTGRVTFAGADKPAPFPSAVVILRPRPEWTSGDERVTFSLPTRHDYSNPWTRLKVVRDDD